MKIENMTARATDLEDPRRAVAIEWNDQHATKYRAWLSKDGTLGKRAFTVPASDRFDPTSLDLTKKTWEHVRKAIETFLGDGAENLIDRLFEKRQADKEAAAQAFEKARVAAVLERLAAAGFADYTEQDVLDLEAIFLPPREPI